MALILVFLVIAELRTLAAFSAAPDGELVLPPVRISRMVVPAAPSVSVAFVRRAIFVAEILARTLL